MVRSAFPILSEWPVPGIVKFITIENSASALPCRPRVNAFCMPWLFDTVVNSPRIASYLCRVAMEREPERMCCKLLMFLQSPGCKTFLNTGLLLVTRVYLYDSIDTFTWSKDKLNNLSTTDKHATLAPIKMVMGTTP